MVTKYKKSINDFIIFYAVCKYQLCGKYKSIKSITKIIKITKHSIIVMNNRNKIFIYTIYTFIPKENKKKHKRTFYRKKRTKREHFYTKREHFFDTYNLNKFWRSKNLVERYPTEKNSEILEKAILSPPETYTFMLPFKSINLW